MTPTGSERTNAFGETLRRASDRRPQRFDDAAVALTGQVNVPERLHTASRKCHHPVTATLAKCAQCSSFAVRAPPSHRGAPNEACVPKSPGYPTLTERWSVVTM